MTPYQAAILDGLSPGARLLIPVLEKLARGHDECWSSTAKLAATLRVCERTVRNYFRELASARLIEVVRDYTLRTRRRVRLLWRSARESLPFVTANVSPDSRQDLPSDPPPLKEEGNKGEDDTEAAAPESSSSSEAAPPGEEPPPAEPDPPPAAPAAGPPPELMARAVKVWRPDPSLGPLIAEAATLAPPEYVACALEVCERKARTVPITVGFLFAVIRNLVAQGGPAPRPVRLTNDERLARERAERERDRAPAEAEEAPPTPETVAQWRAWAATGDRVQKGIALRALARWGIDP